MATNVCVPIVMFISQESETSLLEPTIVHTASPERERERERETSLLEPTIVHTASPVREREREGKRERETEKPHTV